MNAHLELMTVMRMRHAQIHQDLSHAHAPLVFQEVDNSVQVGYFLTLQVMAWARF